MLSKLKNRKTSKDKDILAVRFGYNPNSSSLGINVSLLIYGTLAIALLAPSISLGIRLLKKHQSKP